MIMAFMLDPSGGCFMCRKEISSNSDDDEGGPAPASGRNNNNNITSTRAFLLLTRYLKLDFGVVLGGDLGASPVDPIGGEVSVPLCVGCGALARKFSELYQCLEMLRLKADAVVREMHDVMIAAGGEEKEEEEEKDVTFRRCQRVRPRRGSTLTDKLRKGVVQKCASVVERGPRVILHQLDTNSLQRRRRRIRSHHLQNDADTAGDSTSALQDSPEAANETDNFQENATETHEEEEDDEVGKIKVDTLTSGPHCPKVGSPVVVSSSDDHQQISFKLLPSGKYQCGVCSKELLNKNSVRCHKLVHFPGKSFKCDLCSSSFQYSASLWDHKYKSHRSLFFAKYKDPKLASAQFEKMLEELFDRIQVPKVDNGAYSCVFCGSNRIMKTKGRVQKHFIRHHMKELVPRLEELQQNKLHNEIIIPPTVKKSSSQSTSTSRSRATGHPAQCQYCNRTFSSEKNLRIHIRVKHKVTLFLKFKDSSLSPHEFEQAIKNLFDEVQVPRTPDGGYKCLFCSGSKNKNTVCKSRSVVHVHFIQKHFAQLVSRLMELQKAAVAIQSDWVKQEQGLNSPMMSYDDESSSDEFGMDVDPSSSNCQEIEHSISNNYSYDNDSNDKSYKDNFVKLEACTEGVEEGSGPQGEMCN